MAGFRHSSDFESAGTRCDAWLFRPTRGEDPPVVVMAHGLAGEKPWRLPALARRFARRGLAVLLFDYRGFGDSDGDPRYLVDVQRQVEDWDAAVEHAESLDSVGDQVALWGTSLSAGHAVTVAARRDVDALALQIPFLDGRAQATLRIKQGGPGWALRAGLAGLRDRFRTATFRGPNYVPVVADPGEFAALDSPGAKVGYEAIVPDADWPNQVAARVFLQVPFYRPISAADEVECPTLVIEAEEDEVVPSGPVDDLVETLPDVERVRYEMGHFDAYLQPAFDRVVERQADFLARHLGTTAEPERPEGPPEREPSVVDHRHA